MLEVLRKAGVELFKEFSTMERGTLDVEYSSLPRGAGGDPTHPMDQLAEDIIISALRDMDEPLTVVSEEAGRLELRGGGKFVLIDPLDGSRNAITGLPFYGSAIAVAEGGRLGDVELAYVINLVNGDEFWARRGRGAYMNAAPVHTQEGEDFKVLGFDAHAPARDVPAIMPLIGGARKVRSLGSTALGFALLAAGSISVFAVPSSSRTFDFAGGWLMVREAGGVVTDIDGGPLDDAHLGLARTPGVLAAANPALHSAALGLLGA